MNKAFTLAEVLITLGILGIIAAITLPAVIENHRKKVLESQFKQTYALIGQAIQEVKANTGIMDLYDYYTVYDETRGGYYNLTAFKNEFLKTVQVVKNDITHITPKYKTYTGKQAYESDSPTYAISTLKHVLVNGSFFNVAMGVNPYNGISLSFIVDINGLKGPNRAGHDLFIFRLIKGDKLVGAKMTNLYTDEELENTPNKGLAGLPCSINSNQSTNGIGCAGYALINECPDDSAKGYWECLPK